MSDLLPEGFELEALPDNFVIEEEDPMPRGNVADAIQEPLQAAGGGIAGMITSGLAGIGELIRTGDLDSAVNLINGMQGEVQRRFAPQTQAGQSSTETVGKAADWFDKEAVRPTFATIPLMSDDLRQNIMEQGVGKGLGQSTLDQFGSPALATTAELLPAVAEMAIPSRYASQASRGIPATTATDLTREVLSPFTKQSKAKDRMTELLQAEEVVDETVGYDIKTPESRENLTSFQKFKRNVLRLDDPKTVENAFEQEALRQGYDRGTLGSIKNATSETKRKMLGMVEMLKSIKEKKSRGQFMRPSDIVGDSLLGRVNKILEVNRSAGARVGAQARKLKGKAVDYRPVYESFASSLDELGVNVRETSGGVATLDFKGSDVQGLTGIESSLRKVFNRVRDTGNADAHDLHKIKQYIDNVVTYGKSAKGLSGSGERVLKNLRADISGLLNDNFDDYRLANKDYSETIQTLDELQSTAGNKLDLSRDTAKGYLGNQLRKLTSNYAVKDDMINLIKNIDDLAVKHGGVYNDNIFDLNMFNDELKDMFGTTARNSLEGNMDAAVKAVGRGEAGLYEAGINKLGEVAEKARGINENAAFDAIEELLRQEGTR